MHMTKVDKKKQYFEFHSLLEMFTSAIKGKTTTEIYLHILLSLQQIS